MKLKATMTPEREREYEELLSYIGLFATVVYQLDPTSSAHPSNAIEEIIRQFGKSKALVGLRQAANDTVEKASSWNLEARAIADDGFRAAGVVILSEITRRYATSYKRIVKRGVIKNETEYHVINAILVDQASAISDADRTVLKGLQKHSNARANCSGCEMFDHPSAGNVCFGSEAAGHGPASVGGVKTGKTRESRLADKFPRRTQAGASRFSSGFSDATDVARALPYTARTPCGAAAITP